MFNVEQFIYTTASIENKKGYQIIAKSEGITEKIAIQLEAYVYPIDIDPSKFDESRSLLELKRDLMAYSRIKNIGTGYDGRENTLYNHTFVFSKKDFNECDYDSRVLDKFYIEDKDARGILPTLSITPTSQTFSSILDITEPTLEKIFKNIFAKKKIALLMDNVELPQKIISMLPKSMRMIQFSTYVIEPKKQPKYDFILNSKLKKSKLEKNYEIILSDEPTTLGKTPFQQSMKYYVQIINNGKFDVLKEIHDEFEKIPSEDSKNKIILAINFIRFQETNDETKREEIAETMLEIIKLDQDVFSFYFEKIKDSLKEYRNIVEKIPREINPTISFIEAMFLLPATLMASFFRTYADQNSEDEEK